MRARIETALKSALGALRINIGTPPAGSLKLNGWAQDTVGRYYVVNQGATLVPISATRHCGLAFDTFGSAYMTDTAIAAGDLVVDGFYIRPDGALRVNSAATPAGDWITGVRVLLGRLYVTTT